MGPEPFELEFLARLDELGQMSSCLRTRANAVHTGVDLQVHRQRCVTPHVANRLGCGRNRFGRVERGTNIVQTSDLDELSQRWLREHEYRLGELPVDADVDRFVDQRDAEPTR